MPAAPSSAASRLAGAELPDFSVSVDSHQQSVTREIHEAAVAAFGTAKRFRRKEYLSDFAHEQENPRWVNFRKVNIQCK